MSGSSASPDLGFVLDEFSPSCLVADADPAVGGIGGLRTVDTTHRVVGPALTVQVDPDQLVDIAPLLGSARPGDIVVVACGGMTSVAMWGGVMAILAEMAGIAGVVVDGAIRDVDELRALGFPAWYRESHPRRCPPAELSGLPVHADVPVRIDEVTIHPGDYVVADENGVSVVPADRVDAVVEGVRALLRTEASIKDTIRSGRTLIELLADFGHL